MNVIYLRCSREEQTPENQLDECMQFAKSRGLEVRNEEIFIEKVSGWKKNIKRPKYDLIKQLAHEGKIENVIVWSLDRWIRNRDTLLEDINFLVERNVKFHSVKESYIQSINIEGPLGKTIREFLFGLMGSMAELESTRRSDRVKIAYQNFQGNHWGRKPLTQTAINKVIKYHKEGMSIRQIRNEVKITDKNNNSKNISIGSVQKIIKKYEMENNIQKCQI